MKTISTRTALTAAALLGMCAEASAISMSVAVTGGSQSGQTSRVKVGHTVHASTNYNRLTAGGSYTVSCGHNSTQPISGSRILFAESLVGPTTLVVTIPASQPASVTLPGFDNIPGGTYFSCTYRWSGFAREGQYTIGVGGIGGVVGGGERSEEGTRAFTMYVPSRTNNQPSNPVCLPPDHKGD